MTTTNTQDIDLDKLTRYGVHESEWEDPSGQRRCEEQFGEYIAGEYVKITDVRDLLARQAAPEAPVCTCPSGDGSLRWPCPQHPQIITSLALPIELVSWEGSNCLFDANNRPLWIDVGRAGRESAEEIVRIVNSYSAIASTGAAPEASTSEQQAIRAGTFDHIERLSQVTTRAYRPVYQVWVANMDGDGVWVNTDKMDYDSKPENARRIVNAPAATIASASTESFADWLAREMPAGTVIADPAWWAPRILRAAQAADDRPTWEDVQARERDIRALQSNVIELKAAQAAHAGADTDLLAAAIETLKMHDEVTGGQDYGYISPKLRAAVRAAMSAAINQEPK